MTPASAPSRRIDEKVKALGDWRGRTLSRVRTLIRQADPDAVEEVKWGDVPVWSHGGLICTGEVYKEHVKLTFARGAALEDPAGLFNSSLEGNTRRAIDLREGDDLDERAFKALVRAAVALNGARTAKPKPAASRRKPAAARRRPAAAEPSPRLLSGGNPQIPKGDGDAPVQAFIAAMPGWKRDVGRRLDALVARAVPGVRKAVRWNSPFYGVEGKGWFLAFHCFDRYVKVTFLRGTSLRPLPPVASKDPNTRYLHVHEDGAIDEPLLVRWLRQAAEQEGDPLF